MKPFDSEPATVGNGVMIALGAESPAVVNTVYKAAIDAGGVCAGKIDASSLKLTGNSYVGI